MSPEEKLDLYCRAYLAALANDRCRGSEDANLCAVAFVNDAEAFEAKIAETREPPRNPRPPMVLP